MKCSRLRSSAEHGAGVSRAGRAGTDTIPTSGAASRMNGELYWPKMRTAALLLAVALTMIALDRPLFCVDGCDVGATQSHDAPSRPCGSCATCHASVVPDTPVTPCYQTGSVAVVALTTIEPVPLHVIDVDHPPRTA